MDKDGYLIKESLGISFLEWDRMFFSYSDYNMYQAYGWGEFKETQGWSIFRMVCEKEGKDAALLQCLYRQYRPLGVFLIWIPGGPLFVKDGIANLDALSCLLKALLNKVKNKRYYLRLYPMQAYSSGAALSLREMGFRRPSCDINAALTYRVDTSLSHEDIVKRLSSNWRRNFRRSLRNKLVFKHSQDRQDFVEFYKVYSKMLERRGVRGHYLKEDIICMMDNISSSARLDLFLCVFDGIILAGRIVYTIGRRAYDLIATTTYEARKFYASHWLMMKIINWCREKGIEYFDLSGVDPWKNKEVFQFKKGLGADFVEQIGEWEISNSSLLRVAVNFYISRSAKR